MVHKKKLEIEASRTKNQKRVETGLLLSQFCHRDFKLIGFFFVLKNLFAVNTNRKTCFLCGARV